MVKEFFGISDIGKVRKKNEDYWIACKKNKLFILADGMGGRLAGDIASKDAANLLQNLLQSNRQHLLTLNVHEYKKSLSYLITKVNSSLYGMSIKHKHLNGMGTTLSSLTLYKDYAVIAHVGDSRVYRINKYGVQRLTRDHSLYKHLKEDKSNNMYYRNVLTRVIGCKPFVDPDIIELRYNAGDVFLLCSDGLSSLVSDIDVYNILLKANSLKDAGIALINMANDCGGHDNITVVLVQV